tara:strand:- start:2311 stop:2907 length:597 start_codon:yes stop_codon:yes gene_type:complete
MEFKVFERLWWATPVWECPVEDIDNKPIVEYCYKVKNEKPGVNISNRGGWHSGELITPIPSSLEQLFNELTVFVNDVPRRYMGTSNLILGNWWININGKYDYNEQHDHQNSVLSGTYYVQVPEKNMGNLLLHRGDNAEFFLTSKVEREQTMANAMTVPCITKESMFYLFPSWVKHSVERNNTDSERISIAFNFVSPNQ